MVAFGGAGPLVAALLAEEIAIDAILVPPFPGALSALGAARADLEGDLVEPVYERAVTRLDELGDADLVIGADGVNSLVRRSHAQAFGATVTTRTVIFSPTLSSILKTRRSVRN